MSFHFATGWACMGTCSVSYPELPDTDGGCPTCWGPLLRLRVPDDLIELPARRDERVSERRVLKAAGL